MYFTRLFNITTFLLLFLPGVVFSNDIKILHERVVSSFINQELNDKGEKSIIFLANKLKDNILSNGSWDDIDYSLITTHDQPNEQHLNRILALSIAENILPQVGYGEVATKALYFWYSTSRTHHNWWWNEIGRPLILGKSALLLDNTLPIVLHQLILSDMPIEVYKTGANRTDIAQAIIFTGLLKKDESLIGKGLSAISDTINITEDEGIQIDSSYHQHGPQIYTGGYGEVFFDTVLYWAYHIKDLQWFYPKEKYDLLVQYFLDGVRWMNRNGILDYNIRGRGISRKMGINKSSLLRQIQYISVLSPEYAIEIEQFKQHILGSSSSLVGFKHFWRSDYSTKVGKGHFIGIKMNSNRTYPIEAGNGENLFGNWIGFGSTFIMLNGNEYHNIFPVWNWSLIPGVTSPQFATKPTDWGNIMMNTTFVGGVSNDLYGVSVMDMDVYDTQAKKAWFSFDDEVVALGAGITSSRPEHVNTTINQTRLNGIVTVDNEKMNRGNRALNNASWIHHNDVGYVFPASWYGHLYNQQQKGNWFDINLGQVNQVVQDDVFTLRIGHGWQPKNSKYEYIIVPNQTSEQTRTYAENLPIVILSNTKELQAVNHLNLKITGAIFHEPGSIILTDGSVISVNKPSVLLIDQSKNIEPLITISTPGRGDRVTITLEKNGKKQQLSIQTSAQERWLGKDEIVDFSEFSRPPKKIIVSSDTFVRDGQYSNQSFGHYSYLVVKKDGVGYNRKSILQFKLSENDSKYLNKAVLRLHLQNINTNTISNLKISQLENLDWSESTLSWFLLADKVKAEQSFSIHLEDANSWIEVDVTNLVSSDVVNFLIDYNESNNSPYISFYSRESIYQPELMIYF